MSTELDDVYFNTDYMAKYQDVFCEVIADMLQGETISNSSLKVQQDSVQNVQGVVRAIEVWILLLNGHRYKLEHIAVSVEDNLKELRISALKQWKKSLYKPTFHIPNMYKVVSTSAIAEMYIRDIL